MIDQEKLVSTTALREKLKALNDQIAEQRKLRADDDPFFKHTEWCVLEFEAAIREAEREYVSTTRASELTGWSAQTLRRWGKAVLAGEAVPEAWEKLLVRMDTGDLALCVSSIPVKGQAAA